jgi:L-amino acid N-acyltransferase YncA
MEITRLTSNDIESASDVYIQGLKMETPPGTANKEDIIRYLNETHCYIAKENNHIYGLVSFLVIDNNIVIDFICSIKQRCGIAKKLMQKVANYAKNHNYIEIQSTVSSINPSALKFYEKLGFKTYGFCSIDNIQIKKIKITPQTIINTQINTQIIQNI